MQKIDDTLLENFINQFYGYGNYQADFWLVGLEEGGGSSLEDINQRLKTWQKRGCRELEDLAEYHLEMGITSLFRKRPKIQSTWGRLIRVILAANGSVPTTDQVRHYQRDNLGRLNGRTCLVELFPLPSKSKNHWLYGDFSQLPYLANRTIYQSTLINRRIENLRQRLEQYRPKVVLFYSFTELESWRKIARVDFSHQPNHDIYIGRRDEQLFIILKHPATYGITNNYYNQVGQLINVIQPK